MRRYANFCNRELNVEEQKIFTGLDEGFFKNFNMEQSAYKQELLGVAQSIPNLVKRILKLIDYNQPEEWQALLSDVMDILAQNPEDKYAWLKMHEVVAKVEGAGVAKALMSELTQKFGHLL